MDFAIKSSEAGELLLQQEAVDRVSGVSDTASTTMGGGSAFRISSSASDIEDISNVLQGVYVVFYNTVNGQIYGVATVDTASMRTVNGVQEAPLVLRNANIAADGTITAGTQRNSILQMVADTTYYITAVTYLNGDLVDGSMISATQGASLAGMVNLQFASSANLTPMEYTFGASGT